MEAAKATIALAVFGGLHDTTEVDRNTLIALSSLASRRGRLVGFVEFGFEADRTVVYLGGDRQTRFSNGILVHVTDAARMHTSETLVPNDAKGVTSQAVDLPSDSLVRVVKNLCWRSRIDST